MKKADDGRVFEGNCDEWVVIVRVFANLKRSPLSCTCSPGRSRRVSDNQGDKA